jgi:hypothetical protein
MMAAVDDDAPGRQWAVPGSAAAQEDAPLVGPLAPAGDRAGTGVGGPRGEGADGAVPQVALRPMTVADVLDGAFTVVKARPLRILAISAAFAAPVQLAAAYLQRSAVVGYEDLWLSADPTLAGEADSSGPSDALLWFLLLAVPSIALVCVAAAIGHLVSGWSVGRDPSGREMVGVVARRWWPLLGSFVIVHLAEAGGVLVCYVGVLFVMPLFVVVAPAIGVEGASATEAVRRSIRLIRPRYWSVLWLALLMGVVSTVLGAALASLPQGLAVLVGLEDGWLLLALGGTASQIVITPFVAAASVLLYFDLRVRTEGLDLEITARRLLDRAA